MSVDMTKRISVRSASNVFPVVQYIPEGEMTPFVRAFNQSVGKNLDLLIGIVHTKRTKFYRRDRLPLRWDKFRNPLNGGLNRLP